MACYRGPRTHVLGEPTLLVEAVEQQLLLVGSVDWTRLGQGLHDVDCSMKLCIDQGR